MIISLTLSPKCTTASFSLQNLNIVFSNMTQLLKLCMETDTIMTRAFFKLYSFTETNTNPCSHSIEITKMYLCRVQTKMPSSTCEQDIKINYINLYIQQQHLICVNIVYLVLSSFYSFVSTYRVYVPVQVFYIRLIPILLKV